MSREVLGTIEAASDSGERAPEAAPVLELDADAASPEPDSQERVPPAPTPDWRARAAAALDRMRSSRPRTVAALVGVAAAASLLAAGITGWAAQTSQEGTAQAVAWAEPTDLADVAYESTTVSIHVVNSGAAPFTVTDADFRGGVDQSLVDVSMETPFTVQPGELGRGTATAQARECDGPFSRGGSRDGRLRVAVRTEDLRSTVLSGTSVGSSSLSAVDIYERVCSAGVDLPLLIESSLVRADGRLHIAAVPAGTEPVEVSFSAPDGIRLVTDPPTPVVLTASGPTTFIALAVEVTACTVSAQQLNAGEQIKLLVDGEVQEYALDYSVVNPWLVRTVTQECG